MKFLASLAATLTLAALVPAAAQAAADPVGVGVVRADADERGTFSVPVWTDGAGAHIATVVATIRDGETTVATVPLAPQTTPGWWAPASPLRLAEDQGEIATLGTYAIDIEATDSQANVGDRADAGTLDFTLRPEFDPSYAPYGFGFTGVPMTLYSHQIGVKGRLVGVQPGSGDIVPLPGRTLSITRSYSTDMPDYVADTTVDATTDDDGNFTTPPASQTWWANYRASFTADDTVHGTINGYASPWVSQRDVIVDAQPARDIVEPGQRITIVGRVLDGSTPLAGVRMRLSTDGWGGYDQDPVVVTTDANGRFSGGVTAVAHSVAGPAPVHWEADTEDPFVSGSASGNVAVPDESRYAGVSIVLDPTGRVTARGRLEPIYDSADSIYTWEMSYLQYSRDGRSGWKNVASAGALPSTRIRLSAAGHVDGYYRLYHPASDDLAHAYSAVYHRSRIVTRIAGNDATPEPIRAGRTLTVRGTLLQYRGGWRAMGHQHVELWFLAKGAKRWSYVSSSSTDSRGHAVLHGTARKTGRWIVQYWGDSAHFNSYATSDPVAVR